MKGKAAFVLGAGLGYLVGTPAGREKLTKAKSKLTESWNDPRVQEKVGDLRNKATSGSSGSSSEDPWASPSPDVSSPSSSTSGSSTSGSSSTGSSTTGSSTPGSSTPGSSTSGSGGSDLGGSSGSGYRSTP